MSYFDIYDRHFSRYQDKPVKVLEIGVSHGGSLQLWREYFGPASYITGVDIDPRCSDYIEPGIGVIIADQSNIKVMSEIGDIVGPFDIVIDDGSHVREHQEASFKALWPSTRGVYLIEDCHDGYPAVMPIGGLRSLYPWVYVMERPKRLIRGTPSRELRQDEIEAINLYSDV